MDFQESSPIEHGFSIAYRDHLLPLLRRKERERLLQVTRIKKMCWFIFCACLLTAGTLWLFTGPGDFFHGMVILFGTAALLGPLAYWRVMSDRWSASVAELIMPVIAEHLGTLSYQDHPPHSFPDRAMEALGVVPDYDKANLSHWIKGTYRDTDFELVQADLINKGNQSATGGKRQVDAFNGLLLHIATPKKAPGQILITKDQGKLGRGIGKLWTQITNGSLQHVVFGNADFEKAYDVLASDPAGAREFLSDETLSNLLNIAISEDAHFGPQLVTVGFEERSFYLAIRRDRKFLQMSNINQSLTECGEMVQTAFAEIERIHKIINQLPR